MIIATLLLVVAASAQAQPSPQTKLRLGLIPIYDTLPVWVGRDEGYFKEAGIDLELVATAGGAVAIPAMEGGSIEIAYSDVVTIMRAAARGLKLRIIAAAANISPTPERDGTRFMTLNRSPIEKLSDLKGKKVAVNLIGNMAHLYTLAALDRVGVAPGQYTLVEFPYPQIPDALLNGQVDAAYVVDPMVSMLRKTGKVRDLGSTVHAVHPNFRVSSFVVSQRWLDQNQEAARRFQRAYNRASEYVTRSRDKQGAWQVKYFRLNPEFKDEVASVEYKDAAMGPDFVDSLQTTLDYMRKYKFIESGVDLNQLVFR